LLSFRDSVREVRHSDLDLRHSGRDELQRLVVSDLIGRAVRAKVIREGREHELELVPAELDG